MEVSKHVLPPCKTTAKIIIRLQNKYPSDLSENRALWKSDNQGLKEATFILTGRRGGDVGRGIDMGKGGEVDRRREGVEQAVPHSHVVDKNREGYLVSDQSQPQTKYPAQGSTTRKISPDNFWL